MKIKRNCFRCSVSKLYNCIRVQLCGERKRKCDRRQWPSVRSSCRKPGFSCQHPPRVAHKDSGNSSSRGSNTLFWPPQAPTCTQCTHTHASTHIHIEDNTQKLLPPPFVFVLKSKAREALPQTEQLREVSCAQTKLLLSCAQWSVQHQYTLHPHAWPYTKHSAFQWPLALCTVGNLLVL